MVTGYALYTFFSLQHAKSAAYFARQAADTENQLNPDLISSELHTALSAQVTGCLFSSVAFLEATINELFADAKDSKGAANNLSVQTQKVIAAVWSSETDQKSTLCKYQLFLEAAGAPALDKSRQPYSEVALLIKLRNNLIHYNASWLDTGTAKMLRSGALVTSKLDNPVAQLPKLPGIAGQSSTAWLSSGTAKWAFSSALAFTEEFYQLLKITPQHDHIRDELRLT